VRTRLIEHLHEELLRDVALQQPVPILAEHRRNPYWLVHVQPHEPAEQQIVFQLLHQHPLAANRMEEGRFNETVEIARASAPRSDSNDFGLASTIAHFHFSRKDFAKAYEVLAPAFRKLEQLDLLRRPKHLNASVPFGCVTGLVALYGVALLAKKPAGWRDHSRDAFRCLEDMGVQRGPQKVLLLNPGIREIADQSEQTHSIVDTHRVPPLTLPCVTLVKEAIAFVFPQPN
jgi:hypothetical protein